MSLQQLPYFKNGDTFDLPIQLCDATTNEGIEITDDMQFSASVRDQYGKLLAELQVEPYPDQEESPGYVLISSSASTEAWTIGLAQMDIKLVQLGAVRHSKTIDFNIVRAIT